jgi:hypothetical protein
LKELPVRKAARRTRLKYFAILLILACLVFAVWSWPRPPAAESTVEFLGYTTNAMGRLATFRLTSGFRWPIRYGITTRTYPPDGFPRLDSPLPVFTEVPRTVAPGKSDNFSVAVPAGGTPWIVLVRARKVTGTFDDLCAVVQRSLYGAKFRLPVNLDSVAEKIPHEKITTHMLRGPGMSD